MVLLLLLRIVSLFVAGVVAVVVVVVVIIVMFIIIYCYTYFDSPLLSIFYIHPFSSCVPQHQQHSRFVARAPSLWFTMSLHFDP